MDRISKSSSFFPITPDLLACILLLVSTVLVYFNRGRAKSRSTLLPEGPTGLPVLGNIHQLIGKPVHHQLSTWATAYPVLFTVRLSPVYTAVVVNDLKAIREIFSGQLSTGKPNPAPLILPFQGQYGVLSAEGTDWSEQRQYCVRALKDMGFGKSVSMECSISYEVDQTIVWLKSKTDPVFPLHQLQKSTLNIIWCLVTGETFGSGDAEFSILVGRYIEAVQIAMRTGLVFFPWLKHLFPEKSGHNMLEQRAQDIITYITDCFKKHRDGHGQDLISLYIQKLAKESNTKSSFYGDEGMKHCVGSVVSLFFGGGETTGSTLTWLLFYLATHQNVQDKLHEEIKVVLGEAGSVTLSDKSRMPYANAVIQETLRKSSLFPLGLIHKCIGSLKYGKYVFPKGTLLIANLYQVHHDIATWRDPENFRPERFLEDVNLKDRLIPFQAGKRVCLAESLARDMLFLYTVRMIQEFAVSPDPRQADLAEYLKPNQGILQLPPSLSLCFTPRD